MGEKTKEPLLEPVARKVRFNKILKHITPNSVVVDIGCGHTPHLLNRLETYIKSGVGIDPLIKNRHKGKIKLTSCLLSKKIPIKSNYADFVTLSAVLEHLEDPSSILKEAHRILKKDGLILITVPSPIAKPVAEFLAFRLGLISVREIAEHKRYFWGKELVEMFKKAGFKEIKHEYFWFYWNNFVIAKK
jgi:ubiquinone/menaquinone biosynthesis C-methylase UbiE